MEARYGFVYIWRDRKHKRYYIGSHWGLETDKYKCSSPWMLNSMKRRPQDFKRRILERHNKISYRDLREREHYWLDQIKDKELGVRYYNYHKSRNHWMACDNSKSIKEKLSIAKLGKPRAGDPSKWKHTEESKQKMSVAKTGKKLWPNGRIFSEETRKKMSIARQGKTPWNKGLKRA